MIWRFSSGSFNFFMSVMADKKDLHIVFCESLRFMMNFGNEWTRSIIEEYLREFPGAILTVSHDRYFLDKVTGRTLELDQAALHNYLGNYTYYRERVKAGELQELSESQVKDRPSQAAGAKVQDKPKLNKAKTRAQIASLEQNIEAMEARLGELSGLLADPVTYQDEAEAKNLVQEYKLLEEQIPDTYAEWERLTDLLANS